MATGLTDLNTPSRTLLGPGPSMVHPRTLRAMATPLVGHLDPSFVQLMHDVQAMLRPLFGTDNELTLAVSGTGTAAMEAALSNLIEPGDRVLACVHGYFGERLAQMSERYGAKVQRLERPWGEVFDPDEVRAALGGHPAAVVTLVHAETSTGARQPDIEAIAAACHELDACLVLDCVTSFAGMPVEVDAWGVDIAYSAGQKSLSAPPGLSPITVSPRAVERIQARSTPPPVFYLDLQQLASYWGEQPSYHHTAPITTMYGLREALRIAHEEGLPSRYARHRDNAELLWAGLESLDIGLLIDPPLRLPQLSTPVVPASIDEAQVRSRLLHDYNIEIAGGFGPLAGKIWRIGLMGHSSRKENVLLLLAALRQLMLESA